MFCYSVNSFWSEWKINLVTTDSPSKKFEKLWMKRILTFLNKEIY